jgi:hypothetical protein
LHPGPENNKIFIIAVAASSLDAFPVRYPVSLKTQPLLGAFFQHLVRAAIAADYSETGHMIYLPFARTASVILVRKGLNPMESSLIISIFVLYTMLLKPGVFIILNNKSKSLLAALFIKYLRFINSMYFFFSLNTSECQR